eukprot:365471-Chlamydomonas_euryale.AAC.23
MAVHLHLCHAAGMANGLRRSPLARHASFRPHSAVALSMAGHTSCNWPNVCGDTLWSTGAEARGGASAHGHGEAAGRDGAYGTAQARMESLVRVGDLAVLWPSVLGPTMLA